MFWALSRLLPLLRSWLTPRFLPHEGLASSWPPYLLSHERRTLLKPVWGPNTFPRMCRGCAPGPRPRSYLFDRFGAQTRLHPPFRGGSPIGLGAMGPHGYLRGGGRGEPRPPLFHYLLHPPSTSTCPSSVRPTTTAMALANYDGGTDPGLPRRHRPRLPAKDRLLPRSLVT